MFLSTNTDIVGLRGRIHVPVEAPALGAMLYLHGGGWTMFSIDTHDRLMREYAARAGVIVVGIDYSLSPEQKYPVALHEVVRAVGWLRDAGAAHGIDGTRLAIGGDSAGANLALAAALMMREQGDPPLRGLLFNYGAFGAETSPSYERYDGPDFFLTVEEMRRFWNNYVRSPADLDNPLVAPLLADLHGLPPTFFCIAACDILADGNRAMAARMAAAHVPAEVYVYEGATHSFLEAMSIAPLAQRALDTAAGWLRARLT
jgi:acetyl esterase